ncbi:MAG: glycosyltransferase, partial [Elsteraceae bacterium]
VPYHVLRKELGLPPGANPLFEGAWSPQGMLALYSPLLGGPQRDWPANVTITGFPEDDGGRMDGTPLGLGPDLLRFLDEGPPPLVFALGSAAAFRPGDFFDVAAAAARDLGRRAVVVLGEAPQAEIADRDDLFVCRDAPSFAALFPRAAAVIHQGGVGTLARALASGRPSLVVPFAFDQADNAARAVRLGCALSIPRSRWSRERAAKALNRLLSDPAIADAAARIGGALRAENGAAVAVDAIERRLAGTS